MSSKLTIEIVKEGVKIHSELTIFQDYASDIVFIVKLRLISHLAFSV